MSIHREFDLMIWETNPSKRNINNKIKFYFPNNIKIKTGDILQKDDVGKLSTYEIVEILETRKGLIKHTNYITAITKWRLS